RGDISPRHRVQAVYEQVPACEFVDIGLVKFVERLTGERLGDAQLHTTQRLERPLVALQVTLDQFEAPLQRRQRVKGYVHDLMAWMRDDTRRKGTDTFEKLEVTCRIIDEHRCLLSLFRSEIPFS